MAFGYIWGGVFTERFASGEIAWLGIFGIWDI
jgi:hypothetical protein